MVCVTWRVYSGECGPSVFRVIGSVIGASGYGLPGRARPQHVENVVGEHPGHDRPGGGAGHQGVTSASVNSGSCWTVSSSAPRVIGMPSVWARSTHDAANLWR